jgi:hypothetical protein
MRFARVMHDLGPLALLMAVPLLAGAALGATGWPAVPERLALDTTGMKVQNGRAVMYVGDTVALVAATYGTTGQRLTGQRIRWETVLVPKGQPYAGKVSAGRFVAAGRLTGTQFGFVYGRVQWLTTTTGTVKLTVPFTFPVMQRNPRPDSVAAISVAYPLEPGLAGADAAPPRPFTRLANIYARDAGGGAVRPPYRCQQLVPGEMGDSTRVLSDTLAEVRANSGTVAPGWGKAPAWCVPPGMAVWAMSATGMHVRYYPKSEG